MDNSILLKIIKSIEEANEFVYISVPWWWSDTVGEKICKALHDAKKRGVNINVELRPTVQNKRIRQKLVNFDTEITENVKLHMKIVCSEKEYSLTTANFHNKDMLINDNQIEQFKDKERIKNYIDAFESRKQKKIRTFDGPEIESKASDLIDDFNILNLIKSLIGEKKLNPLQSLSCRHAYYGNENLLVIAPTGSGKSLIGQLSIFRSILVNQSKAVWIVPSRALARQTAKNFTCLNNEKLNPLCLLGSEEVKEEDLIKKKLWICTTEKFEALLRKKSITKITEEIETIVIDEIHNLSDKNRGQTIESLIARYRDRSPQKRIVGLSATLKNDEEFAAWCNARLVKSLYRQSIINKEVIKYESNQLSWKEEEIIKTETLINLIKKIILDKEKDGSILVFCFARATCLESAFRLVNYLSNEVIEYDKSKLEISDAQFENLKNYKVGINFSGFNKSKLFLDLFEKGEIKYLFTTSGLTAGINSPAKNVIIRDSKRRDELISLNEIQQMFGRAARDKGSEGWAFLITNVSQYNYWNERINQDSAISSVIGTHLEGIILAEIYLGNVINENEILDWYSNSFRSFQENRKEDDVKEEIIETIDFLLKNNFIIRDSESKLNITKFGDASIKFMVDLKVALNICKALPFQKLPNTARKAEITLLKIICGNIFSTKVFNNNILEKELLFDYCKKLNLSFSSDNNDDLKKYIPLITAFIFLYEKELFLKISNKNQSFKIFSIELFEEMDRYCTWLSMIGTYTESPWISFCAFDMSYRFRFWKLNNLTYRGSSSILNFFNKLIDDENKENALKNALFRAFEKNIFHPNDIPKSTIGFTFSNDTKQIKKLISNLVDFRELKIDFDKKINKFRIINPPKYLRTTFSQVISSNSGSNSTTFIENNEEIILEVPSITSNSETYYVLIMFETFTDRNIVFFKKELINLRADKSKQDFYKELNKTINLLPDTQIIKSKNSIFQKIKNKLKINNISLREIDEIVARRDYYFSLLQLFRGISNNTNEICININEEINKIFNLVPSESDQIQLRSVPSIIKSGKANILERELVKLTLFLNSNINTGIVQTTNNSYHCIVQINQEWFSFENLNYKSVTPIWPRNFKVGSLRVFIKDNIKGKKSVDINLEWIKEFNHPTKNIFQEINF